MRMLVTAYCPCSKCCGKFSDNITANGKSVYANNSMFVAADTRLLKFGTMLSIPGYKGGRNVPVWDRGGKIRGHHLDVFFLSHKQAQKWGKQYLNVKVRVK
jgi:3D (Asp-Asp-Asp) domain-containing protein